MRLHLDIETFSEANLKTEGVYRYAEHPSTDLNIVCFAIDDGPVHVWLPWDVETIPAEISKRLFDEITEYCEKRSLLWIRKHCPDHLFAALRECRVAAHNAQFERVVLNGVAGEKHSFPKIPIKNTVCTMAKAAVHGLPQALEYAAKALGTHPKREDGRNDMRYIAKLRQNGTRPTIQEEPARFIAATKYCIDDVKAERDLDNHIPDLTERETEIYYLDQRINERGVTVDTENVVNAIALVDQYKTKLAAIVKRLTGYKPTQTAKLAEWIRDNGYPQLPNLQAPTVLDALKDDECPKKIKKVLKCYSTHNMKAVTKFNAMLRAVGVDGRLRGMFVFYGAGPGRWSSRIVQLQNLMRPLIKNIDEAIDAMWMQELDELQAVAPDVDIMKILASCTRGLLTAGEDRDLMAYDFSQIESRIQAWLADAEWKLKIFREDKIKVYNADGAMMFGCKPEEVIDAGENQLYTAAKIGSLACGYQGGAVAIDTFARDMGVTLSISSDEIKHRWRKANREQVQLWFDLEQACAWAIHQKGKAYGIPNKRIQFKVVGRWLYMRLPSGRRIAYLDPELHGNFVQDNYDITYMGIDTYSRKWKRVQTYGGKLLQNACEGIGRDLLANGLLNMEASGYETIMTVHDEGVFEVPKDFGSDEEATWLMTVPLQWAEGLPVKCDGWRGYRYRKGD